MITLAPNIVAILAAFAGGPVSVQCPTDLGWETFGQADETNRIVYLIDYGCEYTNRFARTHHIPKPHFDGFGTEERDEILALSLVMLVHEAGHILRPGSSEACTQRYAVRHVGFFAKRLGASDKVRRKIVRLAYAESRDLPREYQPMFCMT